MFIRYCILLAIFLGYGFCGSEKNISRQLNGTVSGNQTLTCADGPYLVTSDLVVPENATLTIESGTHVNFVPSVGIRVRGSFHAKGTSSHRITLRAVPCGETPFCNNTNAAEFYSRGIRLVDGTSHSNGRLQLQYNGQWGAICNDWSSWDFTDTQVACRHLGFLGAKQYYKYYSSHPLIIENVRCQGNEESLWDCHYRWLWGDGSYCAYGWTVGIECDTLLPYFAEKVFWKGIYFEPANSLEELGSSSLEHVDMVNAFVGVNAMKIAPKIQHVTINDSASGLDIRELAKPLTVVDSSILRPMLAGVSIESSGGNVVIENVTVQSARFGGGLVSSAWQ